MWSENVIVQCGHIARLKSDIDVFAKPVKASTYLLDV